MTMQKTVKYLTLLDYIDLAILKNYMLFILITSGAKGKLPTLGFDYGVGKSTRGLHMLCKHVYAGNWEKVKHNCIGAYWEIKNILDRRYVTLGIYWDDMQLTIGKDKQHNPEIKELAYYLTTVRPYVKIWIGSAPHRGMLHKDFRELFHFEIICPSRGRYEVQQLKRLIDFKKPMYVKEKLHYRGQGRFVSLPPKIQAWYDKWRHQKNMEIRSKLGAFKGVAELQLSPDKLTDLEKEVIDYIVKHGFVRYETLHDKGLAGVSIKLKRRGWLELDRHRRYMLTAEAEEVFFA